MRVKLVSARVTSGLETRLNTALIRATGLSLACLGLKGHYHHLIINVEFYFVCQVFILSAKDNRSCLRQGAQYWHLPASFSAKWLSYGRKLIRELCNIKFPFSRQDNISLCVLTTNIREKVYREQLMTPEPLFNPAYQLEFWNHFCL